MKRKLYISGTRNGVRKEIPEMSERLAISTC